MKHTNTNGQYSRCEQIFKQCQLQFKRVYERFESKGRIELDPWQVEDSSDSNEKKILNSGGGISLVVDGETLERAACGFSSVGGQMNEAQASKIFGREASATEFRATGVSIIVHPTNPHVPSFHANLRYFTTDTVSWFGGGCDLTPYFVVDDDIEYFHQQLKLVCDKFREGAHQEYKEHCDRYFYLPHRKERRGVGGIFFDYLDRDNSIGFESCFNFVIELAALFPKLYEELVARNIDKPWTQKQREFQLWRRGRYVEFNLLYDRGTTFGLETGGRVESILSSLPPVVNWRYDYQPDGEEKRIMELVRG